MKDALYDEMDVLAKPLPPVEQEDPNYYWFDVEKENTDEVH
jgi:hypothetical protein